MKNLLLVLLTFILLSSCDRATDELACKTSVCEAFPKAIEIKNPTGKNFTWLVLDEDSSTWYVQTMSIWSPKVTGKELIFKHK